MTQSSTCLSHVCGCVCMCVCVCVCVTQRGHIAGVDYDTEQHLPLLVRAVYADRAPRLVVMIRNPVKRFYSNYAA